MQDDVHAKGLSSTYLNEDVKRIRHSRFGALILISYAIDTLAHVNIYAMAMIYAYTHISSAFQCMFPAITITITITITTSLSTILTKVYRAFTLSVIFNYWHVHLCGTNMAGTNVNQCVGKPSPDAL